MSFHTEPYVLCDECGARYNHPIKRKEMADKGWTVSRGYDFCPKCKQDNADLPAQVRKQIAQAEASRG